MNKDISLGLLVLAAAIGFALAALAADMEKNTIFFLSWLSGGCFCVGTIFVLSGMSPQAQEQESQPLPPPSLPPLPPLGPRLYYAPATAEETLFDALQRWVSENPDFRVQVAADGRFLAQLDDKPDGLLVIISGETEVAHTPEVGDEFDELEYGGN